MINILENLISIPLIFASSALADLIILLRTPVGFVASFSSLIFLGNLTAQSIVKDPNRINPRKMLVCVKNYYSKYSHLNFAQQTTLNTIFQKENICIKEISSNIGITVSSTRKLVKSLIDKKYVVREINIKDKRSFCYTISDKYKKLNNNKNYGFI